MIAELLSASGFASALFSGLAATPEAAALQKSAVVQALRTVFPAPSAFVEEDARWDFSTEPDDIHYRLQLRCVACPQPSETIEVETETVRYSSIADHPESFNLQFRTKSSPNAFEWRIAGQIEQLQFAVVPKRALLTGAKSDADEFETIACGGRRSCRGAQTFATHSEATHYIGTLHGLVARRSIPAGKPLTAQDFTQPIVVAKGATVTLSMTDDSGLSIRARAIALESGAAGDRIPIRLQMGTWDKSPSQSPNLPTRSLIARITSPDEVLYEK